MKSCPHCDGSASVINLASGHFKVWCFKCKACSGVRNTRRKAVRDWNKRIFCGKKQIKKKVS